MYKFHKSLIALYSQFCPTKVPSAHLYSHSILRFHPEVARSDQRSVKYRSSLFLPLLIPLLPFNQHQSIDEKTIRISPLPIQSSSIVHPHSSGTLYCVSQSNFEAEQHAESNSDFLHETVPSTSCLCYHRPFGNILHFDGLRKLSFDIRPSIIPLTASPSQTSSSSSVSVC